MAGRDKSDIQRICEHLAGELGLDGLEFGTENAGISNEDFSGSVFGALGNTENEKKHNIRRLISKTYEEGLYDVGIDGTMMPGEYFFYPDNELDASLNIFEKDSVKNRIRIVITNEGTAVTLEEGMVVILLRCHAVSGREAERVAALKNNHYE